MAYHSSMGSPAAPRKVIPDSACKCYCNYCANDIIASGFAFLGETSKRSSVDDTFSFVSDAMKASTKK